MEYLLLIIVALVFSAACSCQFRWKFGARFCKRKIPENSVWRKIYPFKENEKNPLLYVKWIPVVITFIILIACLILYIVYWISPSLLSDFLESKLCFWICIAYTNINTIYFIVMIN